jgi:polyhydroxyalkanoate synthesis regulator phasin
MKTILKLISVLALLLSFTYVEAADITNPILKKLVEKGILTERDAISVMEELKNEAETTEKIEKKVEKVAKDVEEVKKDAEKTAGVFKGLSVGAKGYFEYRNGKGADNAGSGLSRNTFKITRAYLDIKKKLTDDLMVRWTSDYETGSTDTSRMFMKYLYLEYKLPLPVESTLTAGVIPAPYIGFYEDLWPYRMIGKIPQEKFKVLDASADMGVQLGGKFKIANADMISYALGVFNNQHYRVNDNNKDKSIEGRLSVKPLAFTKAEYLKGLEFTYFGIRGKDGAESDKGNVNYGDHKNDTLLVGYNFSGLNLGYEYYKTTRFSGTKAANSTVYNKSIDGKNAGAVNNLFFDNATGQTVFGVYRLPGSLKPVRLFSEYAQLDKIKVGAAANPETGKIKSTLFGISYDIYKDKTVLVLDYNNVKYKNIGAAVDDNIFQTVLQIAY